LNKLKSWCGIATRYDKHAVNYRGGVNLGAIVLWLRHFGTSESQLTNSSASVSSRASLTLAPPIGIPHPQRFSYAMEICPSGPRIVNRHSIYALLGSNLISTVHFDASTQDAEVLSHLNEQHGSMCNP